ncbi:hypothetical protein Tco_0517773 [Tanacetum coccineum]
MVAFLQKPSGSEEFHQIVDFLAGSHIRYALTTNSTIYRSLIEQFWQTATVETINEREQQITATVDGHKLAITEASVRGHLQLTDNDGVHVPLFDSMLLHDQSGQGEGLTPSVESQHTPTASSPSTSHHTTSQPTTSQSSPELTTEPFTTIPSPEPQDTQIPQITTFVPHDIPLSGGYTPGSVEGSMKLQELTDLFTPSKALQVEVQSQETFEAELSALSAAKIVAEASKERVKRKGTDSSQVSTASGLFDRKEADDIDWHKIVDQVQERQYGSMMISNSQEEANYSSSSREEHDDIFEEYAQLQDDLFQSFKKLRTSQDSSSEPFQEQSTEEPKELSEEDVKKMLEIVPVKEFRVEALQTKYPIVDWEIHSEDLRKYWKIIRTSNITEAYQSFKDLLKEFDREDLDILWRLVKDRFTSAAPAEDMEKALWVELKRLYELDKDDILWKLQRYMHDPLTWRLYGSCVVHHVSSLRGHDIFMLIERDYPLTTAVMGLMLSRKLQVEEDSEMARDLVMKIFTEANRPRS